VSRDLGWAWAWGFKTGISRTNHTTTHTTHAAASCTELSLSLFPEALSLPVATELANSHQHVLRLHRSPDQKSVSDLCVDTVGYMC